MTKRKIAERIGWAVIITAAVFFTIHILYAIYMHGV